MNKMSTTEIKASAITASTLPAGSPTRFYLAGAAFALALLAIPQIGHAQGIVRGAQDGAYEGNRIAGPVGGVVAILAARRTIRGRSSSRVTSMAHFTSGSAIRTSGPYNSGSVRP